MSLYLFDCVFPFCDCSGTSSFFFNTTVLKHYNVDRNTNKAFADIVKRWTSLFLFALS